MTALAVRPARNKNAPGLSALLRRYITIMDGFIRVARPLSNMAARDRPTLGIAHLTVVPRNFEPEAPEDEEQERGSDA